MVKQLDLLTEWIPQQMTPGSIFPLENPKSFSNAGDPYLAILSCPECGMMGLVTRKQIAGLLSVMCGSDECSAEFFLRDDDIVPRKPS